MPPASLSTLAVMIPGPTTARNSRVRPLQRFRSFMRVFQRHKNYGQPRTGLRPRFETRSLVQGRIRIHGRAVCGIDENESYEKKERFQVLLRGSRRGAFLLLRQFKMV